ncbi:aquaporin-like protein [Cantharellus anzutake]|uniref:aquaporin-like protein n=1 Tax=Cantharellus anzutake TaxID=1750568 RepID=UPI001906F7DD|nr:aquaporin-like protein [Cantharellus anzutake]KAF8337531.1 aquaporin-like protein [Cantharellus anzutake]
MGDPGSLDQLEYCSRSFGLSVFVLVSIFFRVTGGVFNPAISLALWVLGTMKFWRFLLYCIAQLVGAIVAAALLKAFFPGSTNVQTALAPGYGYARGLFLEIVLTACLVLAVLVLATDKRALSGKTIAPIGIAATLYIAHIVSINYTGTGLNPARSFGPAVVEGFRHDHWVFWIGPIIGSLAAASFYSYLQYSKYWTLGNCEDDAHGPILPLSEREPIALASGIVVRGREVIGIPHGSNGPNKGPEGSSTTSAVEGPAVSFTTGETAV